MRCDFFKPLLTESKVNNKNAFKKKRDWARGEKKNNPTTFLRNHPKPVPRTRGCPLHQQGRQKKTASQTTRWERGQQKLEAYL